ncbi:MAG: lipopolysaccharide biosynthesis protein [Nitrospirae bacterium]|nr:lipopolysaccharide biosynthesis protein [Candidatus Manganitrophaceae bacterium]
MMGIVMMLIGYSNLITNFGFNEAIIQKRINDKKVLNSIFTFDLVVSSFFALLFFMLAGYIADFFKTPECKEVIRVMSLVFIISSFTGMPATLLKRDMNFKYISLFDFISSCLMNFITLFLALKGFGYWALAYGQLIPLIIMTVSLCIKTGWIPIFYYSHASLKEIFHFGKWNFMKTQLGFVTQHLDKFIVGRWLGPTSLGFYDKAISVAEMPYNSLIININSVMFSSFSRTNENKHQLQQQFRKSLTLLSFINLPIYFGLIVIAPYFVLVLLGNKWSPMIIPFQIILVSMLIRSFGGLTASLNVGVGKYKDHTILFFIALVAFMITGFLFLSFGIEGIAASYFVFSLIQIYLWMGLSLKNIDLSWKDVLSAVYPGAAASIVMFCVAKLLTQFIFIDYSFINMISVIGISASVYCLYVLLDNSKLTKDLKNIIWEDIKSKTSIVLAQK